MRIYKYPIFDITKLLVDQGTYVNVDIPRHSSGLGVILQGASIVVYYAVDLTKPPETHTHTFYVIGTGYELAPEVTKGAYTFDGSFYHAQYGLVAHVFHAIIH